jgi:ergothioneine biosynthesis protein EgtB
MDNSMHELNKFEHWHQVRQQSLLLVDALSAEDCAVQSMPDASPIKWHLAHTTWFFETFILEKFESGFTAFHPAFRMLFNSYYNGIGEKHPRTQRGLLTRPSLEQVLAYRQNVDARITTVWHETPSAELAKLLELGIQHEQQHQELMLTDAKHLFSCNPLFPAMLMTASAQKSEMPAALRWHRYAAQLVEIGHDGSDFCFDNELPRHRQFVEAFELADRLVTNAEYLDFIKSGGYQEPSLWLAEAWDWIKSSGVQHPLYWRQQDGEAWQEFGLHGLQTFDMHAPVCHLSYFEASAYAQWRGARLPSEAEWEYAAAQPGKLQQLFQHCWQWTSSSYSPYPGFAIPRGAIGEYNGKFMLNQYVLRGSSCYTPAQHARLTYRNFFPASARWQMTGIRLARSLNTI